MGARQDFFLYFFARNVARTIETCIHRNCAHMTVIEERISSELQQHAFLFV